MTNDCLEIIKLRDVRISLELQKKILGGINKLLGITTADFINEVRWKDDVDWQKFPPNLFIGDKDNLICHFSMSQLPGCCGILVSHDMWIEEKYRGKGIAKFLQEIKTDIAKENGYSLLMGTVTSQNEAEKHILSSSGWNKIHEFRNLRTGNSVETWVKLVR